VTLRRREFVSTLAVGAASLAGNLWLARPARAAADSPHLSTNTYPWGTFFSREGRTFRADQDECLAEVAESGVQGLEPGIGSPEEIDTLAPLLKKHGLEMRSLYMNSELHAADKAEASITQIVTVARRAVEVGTTILVTNPSPLQWGGGADKSDAQLETQAAAMNRLGGELRKLGVTLAYHNHDMELRCAAREFHHMMLGTDPALVTLCLDAHWIYRGAANSTVALRDVVTLYGKRVSELHIRQSRDHVWTEALGEGDIDYPQLVEQLRALDVHPLLVLEQAVEAGSPQTMNGVAAHRASVDYARRVFAPLVVK
jgi:inosose dehydratase